MTETPIGSLAVICAIESELTHLRSKLGQAREIEHTGRFYWITELEHDAVILSRCGIGMLSAAAATEGLIAHFRPRAILNFGCSGAHREYLLPGDIVVGTRFVAYDNLRLAPDGTEWYARMRHLHLGEQVRAEYLSAAPHLLEAALRAAKKAEGQARTMAAKHLIASGCRSLCADSRHRYPGLSRPLEPIQILHTADHGTT